MHCLAPGALPALGLLVALGSLGLEQLQMTATRVIDVLLLVHVVSNYSRTCCLIEPISWTVPQQLLHNRQFAHRRHTANQNALPNNSWIKLYVNVQVDLSGGPLIWLKGVIHDGSIDQLGITPQSRFSGPPDQST